MDDRQDIKEIVADLEDELAWDALVQKTRPRLIAAARREIADGLSEPMDYDRL